MRARTHTRRSRSAAHHLHAATTITTTKHTDRKSALIAVLHLLQ